MTGVMFDAESGNVASNEWELTGGDRMSRSSLKSLRTRTNRHGFVFLAVHLLALAVGGLLVYAAMGTAWLLPAMMVHGTVIVLLFAPLHECSHYTAFRTRWVNQAVGRLAALLTFRPFLYFKWRHAEHHTFTQHPRLDPDIVKDPSSLSQYLMLVLGAEFWPKMIGTLWRGTTGHFNETERRFIPASELRRVSAEVRSMVAIYAGILIASVIGQSTVVLWYWLIPRVLGEPVLRAIRMAEHTGTAVSPNLLINTRTTYANPVFRMLYWNMPFHAEHHVASSVPFHALPRMHVELKHHLGYVAASYWDVHKSLIRQALRGHVATAKPSPSDAP